MPDFPTRGACVLFCTCALCSSGSSALASPTELTCSPSACLEYIGEGKHRLVATGDQACCYSPGNGVHIQLLDGILETSPLDGQLIFGQVRIFPGSIAYNLRGLGLSVQPLDDWQLAEANLDWTDPAMEVGVFQEEGSYVVAFTKNGAFYLDHDQTNLHMLLKAPERVAFDSAGSMYYSQDASGVESYRPPHGKGCSVSNPEDGMMAFVLILLLTGDRLRRRKRHR